MRLTKRSTLPVDLKYITLLWRVNFYNKLNTPFTKILRNCWFNQGGFVLHRITPNTSSNTYLIYVAVADVSVKDIVYEDDVRKECVGMADVYSSMLLPYGELTFYCKLNPPHAYHSFYLYCFNYVFPVWICNL